jgi:hypothetical protein
LTRRPRLVPLAAAAFVAVAVVIGVVLRAWLLQHEPLTGDEAQVALMANQIQHGHYYTFYWGQAYGGVEPFLVAAVFSVFGATALSLNATAAILSAVSALLLWRVARRLVPDGWGWLAGVAAGAFWIWPDALVWNSTHEFGFRSMTMLAGVAALLFALRLLERRTFVDVAAFGLALGIGWWSSPELLYFAIPALGMVIFGWRRGTNAAGAPLLVPILLVVGGFVVGAAPWLWTNLHTGFASLRTSASPDYFPSTYGGRLTTFFEKTLPMMLGARLPGSGAWVHGQLGKPLSAVAAVVIAVVCIRALLWLRSAGPAAATAWCAVGVIVFPFIYATFPATSFWQWGDYAVFLVPLILFVLVGTVGQWLRSPGQRSSMPTRAETTWAFCVLFAAAVTASSLLSFDDAWLKPGHQKLFGGWSADPNAVALVSVRDLEGEGVIDAWAPYWGNTAYSIVFLSDERLAVSDAIADRSVALYRRVGAAPRQAWIFLAPGKVSAAETAFQLGSGPSGYPETTFLSKLGTLRVGYRVVHAGVLDAVVPASAVTPQEVGLPPPLWQ